MSSFTKLSVFTLSTALVLQVLQVAPAAAQSHKIKRQGAAPVTEVAPIAAPQEARVSIGGFKFGGFLDAQGLLTNRKDVQTRGFTLNDAALYISKDFTSELSAFIDLPFATPSGAHTNSVGFAEGKAQAYFLFTRDALTAHFGQFDTPFGFEANDSKDRFFADAGAIKTFIVPQTHSGLLAGYKVGSLTMSGLLSNPRNEGTMADTNPEAGALLRFAVPDSSTTVQGGLLLNEEDVPSSNKTNLLIELLASMRFNDFRISGSYDNKKTAGTDKVANAFGAVGVYDTGAPWSFGGRFEYLTDVTETSPAGAGTVDKSVTTLSFGPSYRLAPDVTVRGDASVGVFDYEDPKSDVTVLGATVSVLAAF